MQLEWIAPDSWPHRRPWLKSVGDKTKPKGMNVERGSVMKGGGDNQNGKEVIESRNGKKLSKKILITKRYAVNETITEILMTQN